ncbi:MAG TPA: carboxypeptidase-like regulatory domain-containing protein [Bryobacteraceae bacterium]|jgi:hypothetical protein|nr:carboxypeptidase-like regulatory domain-containing protein [Bryobacteraceae bacterium]
MRLLPLYLLAIYLLAIVGPVSAFVIADQASSALLVSGRVTDPQSNPVAHVRVQLFNPNQILAGEQATDTAGHCGIPVAAPGSYTLKISALGFQQVTRSVQVIVDQPVIADVQLGSLTEKQESITVTADVKDANILFPDPAQRV